MICLALLAALLAAGAAAAGGPGAAAPSRVWVDRSYYIKGETEILEELVHDSRGRLTVNPAKREPPPPPPPPPAHAPAVARSLQAPLPSHALPG
jgi:hypothetical protein